jgi:hypothetical protein
MVSYLPFFLAGSLAICVGFRTFLPLLTLLILSRIGLLDVTFLNPSVSSLITSNEIFLYIIGTAAIFEIIITKTGDLADIFETVNFFLRPLMGGFIMFSFIRLNDPVLNIASTFALGIIFTIPFSNMKEEAKVLTKTLAYNHYNYSLGLIEDLESAAGSVLAIVSPQVAISIIPLGFLLTLHWFKLWKKKLLALKKYEVDTPGESDVFDKERERIINQKKNA